MDKPQKIPKVAKVFIAKIMESCLIAYLFNFLSLLVLVFQVKNKAPAEIQITAEQLLREAKERDLEIVPPVSIQLLQCLKLVYFKF